MAKKKSPLYLKSQAKWRADLVREMSAADIEGDELGAAQIERKIISETEYLKESVRVLRHYVAGFTAADGYALDRVAYWKPERIKRVKRDITIIRQELSHGRVDNKGEFEPLYKVVRPRSAQSRVALENFTGQTHVPGRKAYFVNVTDPRQDISLVKKTIVVRDSLGRKRKETQAAVEVTQIRGKMKIYERYFRFPEPPVTFDDVIAMTRKMLRFMPRGWYVIETSSHGAIYAPVRKDNLLHELQSHFLVYDVVPPGGKDSRGLAETVVGYRLVGMHQEDAFREYDERLSRRQRMQQFRLAQRARNRRRMAQLIQRKPFRNR